ncbi:hypothetical protein LJC22_00415 [Desulfosarcina sp. OttesenSCG-928-G10]|nr:hypothetical protein [Desulfosarcina sp. OttesenSCG-928-G10]
MIHWKQGLDGVHLSPLPQFLPNRVYWVTERNRICYSDDKGATWTILPAGPWATVSTGAGRGRISSFAILSLLEKTLIVSTNKGVWKGYGRRWDRISESPGGAVLCLKDNVFVVVDGNGLLHSKDNGLTWEKLDDFPGHIAALTGSRDSKGKSLLLISIEGKGLFRSANMGKSWELSKEGFENETTIRIPPDQISIAYALQTKSVKTQQLLRTRDGGVSWKPVFHLQPGKLDSVKKNNVELSWLQTRLHWGYCFTENGLDVSAKDPNFCLATTQGELFVTRDGGESWQTLMAKSHSPLEADTERNESIGLEVTSCWGYYFDPHDASREYIAYTDVGFARSLDKGKSWSWSAAGSPWTNTFYEIAFDPDTPGLLYAATSIRHDIPHYTNVAHTFPEARAHQGGVVISRDWGKTWSPPYKPGSDNGLPKQVCTTIAVDPASPAESRRLYAGIFGEQDAAGVYVSEDGGKTWSQTEGQPGVLPNRHVYMLKLHPKTGDIYCLITGYRAPDPNFFNPEGGGIWVSSDKGKNWRHISKGSQLNRWATSFAFDPENDKALYVSAVTPQGGTGAGGIYKTLNSGKTWMQILKDSDAKRLAGGADYDHWMAVNPHPSKPGLVFAGSTLNGLFYSTDSGKRWRWCRGFPFRNAQSITFDPRNPDKVMITTFGAGVWSASLSRILQSQ